MPNILIHPNSGIIEFSTGIAGGSTFNPNFTGGANAVRLSYDNIGGLNITNYSTGLASGIDRFSVDGVNGRLFSVTDSLSGSLFSVNDIAGLPIIEAFDDNTVIMGAFNRNDFVLTGNSLGLGGFPNTGTTKLYVSGNIRADGNIFISGNPVLTGIPDSNWASQNELDSLSGIAVLLTGNQTISGVKTFINDVNVSGTGTFAGLNLDNINNLLLSGMTINISGNSIVNIFNPVRISGNQVLTGVTQDSRAVLTTTNQTIAGIKTFSTEIVTNLIDGADTIFTNALPLIISGGNAAYPFVTGGDINIVGGVGGARNGVINLLSNTNINGNLNVTGNIFLSGNPVLTGVDLSNYVTKSLAIAYGIAL